MLARIGEVIATSASVVIPVLGTIVAGIIIYAKQDYDRVQNIRRAFLAELETVDLPTYIDTSEKALPVPYTTRLAPNSVYNNNTGNVGKLTSEEVSAVVEFYSMAANPGYLNDIMVELEKFVDDPRWVSTQLDEKRASAIENIENGLEMSFWEFLWNKLL